MGLRAKGLIGTLGDRGGLAARASGAPGGQADSSNTADGCVRRGPASRHCLDNKGCITAPTSAGCQWRRPGQPHAVFGATFGV